MAKLSKLRKMRILSGMTQIKLSQQLGISQGYLSLLERGKCEPDEELQAKIREAFELSFKFMD